MPKSEKGRKTLVWLFTEKTATWVTLMKGRDRSCHSASKWQHISTGVWGLFKKSDFIFLFSAIAMSFALAATSVGADGKASAFSKVFEKAKTRFADGHKDDALKLLSDFPDEKLKAHDMQVKYFALGRWYQEVLRYPESKQALQKCLEIKCSQTGYVHYLLGHAFKAEGKLKEAIDHFNKTIESKPARNIIYQARSEFSDIYMALKQPKKAQAHLKYLERRWRGTIQHPDVVWKLIGVELALNRKWRACRWTRTMYSRYAGHPLVKSWGVDLPDNQYEGKALGCLASPNDLKVRIRRLQLYGQEDRARQEIDLLLSRSKPSSRYQVDLMLVQFLERQGYPDEALAALIRHHEQQKNDRRYLTLLAKVASRAGEYPTAIGAYYKMYKMNSRNSTGRRALFSAAFLSYQSQDYDGASRKFQELVKRFPRSGLARDAKWHLAWVRYLKRDFKGAQIAFQKLMKESYRRRRRRYQPFNNDRTRYWLAMSYVRQENLPEAREIFQRIATNNSYSYYSILAHERLRQLPAPDLQRTVASKDNSEDIIQPGDLVTPTPEPETVADAAIADGSEDESEDSLPEDEASAEKAEDIAEGDTTIATPEDAQEEAKDERIVVTPCSDPRVMPRSWDASRGPPL